MATPVPPRQPGRVPSSREISGAPKGKAKVSITKLDSKIKDLSKKTIAKIEKQITSGTKMHLTGGAIEVAQKEVAQLKGDLRRLKAREGKKGELTTDKALKYDSLTAKIQELEDKLSGYYKFFKENGEVFELSKNLDEFRKSGMRDRFAYKDAKLNYEKIIKKYNENQDPFEIEYLFNILTEQYNVISKELQSYRGHNEQIIEFNKVELESIKEAFEKLEPPEIKRSEQETITRELPLLPLTPQDEKILKLAGDLKDTIAEQLKKAEKEPLNAGEYVQEAIDYYETIQTQYEKANDLSELQERLGEELAQAFEGLSQAPELLLLTQSETDLTKKADKGDKTIDPKKLSSIKRKQKLRNRLSKIENYKSPEGFVPTRSRQADGFFKAQKGKSTSVKLSLFERFKSKKGREVAAQIGTIGLNNLRISTDIQAERMSIETQREGSRWRDSRIETIAQNITAQKKAIRDARALASTVKSRSIKSKLNKALQKASAEVQLLIQEKAFLSTIESRDYRKGAQIVNAIDHAINSARMKPKRAAYWIMMAIDGQEQLKNWITHAEKSGQTQVVNLLKAKLQHVKEQIADTSGLLELSDKEKTLRDKILGKLLGKTKPIKGGAKAKYEIMGDKSLKLEPGEASRLGRLLAKEMVALHFDEGDQGNHLQRTFRVQGILSWAKKLPTAVAEKVFSSPGLKAKTNEKRNEPDILSAYQDKFAQKLFTHFYETRIVIGKLLDDTSPKEPLAAANYFNALEMVEVLKSVIDKKVSTIVPDPQLAKIISDDLKKEVAGMKFHLEQKINELKLSSKAKKSLKDLVDKEIMPKKPGLTTREILTKDLVQAMVAQPSDKYKHLLKFLTDIRKDPTADKVIKNDPLIKDMFNSLVNIEIKRALVSGESEALFTLLMKTFPKGLVDLARIDKAQVMQLPLDKNFSTFVDAFIDRMQLGEEERDTLQARVAGSRLNAIRDEVLVTIGTYVTLLDDAAKFLNEIKPNSEDKETLDQYRELLNIHLSDAKNLQEGINKACSKEGKLGAMGLSKYLQENDRFKEFVEKCAPLISLTSQLGKILGGIKTKGLSEREIHILNNLHISPAQQLVKIKNLMESFQKKMKGEDVVDGALNYVDNQIKNMRA